jgi:hypothetical protein
VACCCYQDEVAADEAEKAAAAAAGGSSKAEKRKMNYGDEIVGDLDAKAVAKEAKRLKKAAKKAEKEQLDERKKKYNSFSTESDGDVTQEQMEAYMQAKPRWDDPMSKMKDTT